ncbi:TetR/AcrR family transcriptional regulator [Desulfosudis oleivorans]|uniref:Transcriptional regulator, TetR family n=1 Tax=Desulfosudis oleivorans (strain DSM 6200 / JCM 39069 / Hxd3) TaxID=96561 RepID=A8ZYB2_DESOH|nr:TetR/AcrR family transcriptional regulator [Desulfosudis oleivorans]ABW67119.1 transcriptional regulator, TetR family [Desulfosudis oleivorans Hxd3]
MKQTKKKAKPKVPVAAEETGSKGEATRQKIIAAARKVFTRHPYHAASIRMIGEEGGFDYSIIHHYFTKAELFRAVARQLYEELVTAYREWIDGVEHLTPTEGLKIYLDRSLDYLFEHPDVMEVLTQNAGHMKIDPDPPGFDFFTRYFREIEAIFIEKISVLTMQPELSMWSYTMMALHTAFVGSATYHGKALGMDPQSKEYREWVKEALLSLFAPPLEKFIEAAVENRRSS